MSQNELNVPRRTAWWIADTAAGISISFSVIARVCQLFADHHRLEMTGTEYGFVTQVGHGFGYVAFGWIVVSAIFAVTSRIKYGIANDTTIYLVLLLLAVIAVVVVQ